MTVLEALEAIRLGAKMHRVLNVYEVATLDLASYLAGKPSSADGNIARKRMYDFYLKQWGVGVITVKL